MFFKQDKESTSSLNENLAEIFPLLCEFTLGVSEPFFARNYWLLTPGIRCMLHEMA